MQWLCASPRWWEGSCMICRDRAPDELLTQPAVFALQHGVGDFLDLDLAVLEVTAVDRDRHGAAMVGRGPRRRDADAFEAFRHPILFGVHAFPDVFAVDSTVGLRPLHFFLHVVYGADA